MRPIDADTLWRKMEDSPWNDNADRDFAEELVLSMPTLTLPNEPEHVGIYGKYTVYKNRDGSLVTDCFILRLAKDPAAVAALRAYAAATDNAELAADIINWVGVEPNEPLTWEELKAETKINPVYSVKYGWIFPSTVKDEPYAQIWFFTSKGFAHTELFYHDTFYRRPPEGEEGTKDVYMG